MSQSCSRRNTKENTSSPIFESTSSHPSSSSTSKRKQVQTPRWSLHSRQRLPPKVVIHTVRRQAFRHRSGGWVLLDSQTPAQQRVRRRLVTALVAWGRFAVHRRNSHRHRLVQILVDRRCGGIIPDFGHGDVYKSPPISGNTIEDEFLQHVGEGGQEHYEHTVRERNVYHSLFPPTRTSQFHGFVQVPIVGAPPLVHHIGEGGGGVSEESNETDVGIDKEFGEEEGIIGVVDNWGLGDI